MSPAHQQGCQGSLSAFFFDLEAEIEHGVEGDGPIGIAVTSEHFADEFLKQNFTDRFGEREQAVTVLAEVRCGP